jgi:hypothetical protein
MNWEYKILKLETKGFFGGKIDDSQLEKLFNELGRQGWELVNVFTTNQAQGQSRNVIAVFKRRS